MFTTTTTTINKLTTTDNGQILIRKANLRSTSSRFINESREGWQYSNPQPHFDFSKTKKNILLEKFN